RHTPRRGCEQPECARQSWLGRSVSQGYRICRINKERNLVNHENLVSPVQKETGDRNGSRLLSELNYGNLLCGERSTASATAGSIRVLKGEARTHHSTHVVDLDTVQVLRAEHID